MYEVKRNLFVAVVTILILGAGCSPEASRVLGSGSGADIGNRVLGSSIDVHGATEPMFGVQNIGKAIQVSR
jgi:hypothetical protein